MSSARTVLVTDGEQRSALAIVRSLGRCGNRCVVTSGSGRSLAGASRFSTSDIAVPDALHAPELFAEAIEAIVRADAPALVIPVSEPAMLALLRVRARLAPAIIPFAGLDVFRGISDKAALLAAGSALGIAIPLQRVLRDRADAEAVDATTLEYPIVLKPARSVGEHAGQRQALRVRHVATAAQWRDELRAIPDAAFPVLAQQRIVGPGIGVFLLRWDDEIVASFAHRRLREKPPAGGISVYRESVVASPDLMRRSRQLLEHFGWRGVAMIEYKVDADTGIPYLMEINGRFWGSLQLAIDAGVDFPRLLAACALGEPVASPPSYRRVRSRWWWGEVDHVVTRLRRPPRELHLAPDTPSLGRALCDFLVSPLRPRDREEVFRPDDPRPFFRETELWFRHS